MAEWLGLRQRPSKLTPEEAAQILGFLQSLIGKGYGKFDSIAEYQLTSFTIRCPAGAHSWYFTGRLYPLPPHCRAFDHVQPYPYSEAAGRMVNQNNQNLISCGVTEKFIERFKG